MESQAIKIGLALGGGGAKGAAHIGALKVFEKHGIKISSIVGTSAGAIVGGAYALGLSLDEISKRVTQNFSKSKLLRLGNLNLFNESLIKSQDFENAIKSLTDGYTFPEVKIPFKAVAVDLESGQEVLLEKGKLWEAIRASSAFPGLFSPYFFNEKYLVDGGLLNNVPINYLKQQKDLDLTVAVELGSFTSKQYISGIVYDHYYKKNETPEKNLSLQKTLDYLKALKVNSTLVIHILFRSLDILREEAQNHRYSEAVPDLIIKPEVDDISLLEIERFEEAEKAGETAAEKIMPKLLKLIESKKRNEFKIQRAEVKIADQR